MIIGGLFTGDNVRYILHAKGTMKLELSGMREGRLRGDRIVTSLHVSGLDLREFSFIGQLLQSENLNWTEIFP
jgi:hypothetical protein